MTNSFFLDKPRDLSYSQVSAGWRPGWRTGICDSEEFTMHTMTRREVLKTAARSVMILPAGLARGYAANEKLNAA
jgi:hypothetical protein